MNTLRITSPTMPSIHGQTALIITQLEGSEALSRPFAYRLLLSTPDELGADQEAIANVDFKRLVGYEACVSIELDGKGSFSVGTPGGSAFGVGKGERQICGLITRARYLKTEDRRALYEAVLEPPLVLLQRSSDFRMFQNMSVIEVIASVIKGYAGTQTAQKPGYDFAYLAKISGSYPTKDFWVQYGETDFDFVSRLMEEWGLYYHFDHADGHCSMILCDGPSSHQANPSAAYQAIAYHPPGYKTEDEHFNEAQFEEAFTSGQWVSADFDFKQPKATLTQTLSLPRNTGNNQLEHYQWPNDSFDHHQLANAEQGQLLTRMRAQEMGAQGQQGQLSGHLRGLCCGHTFTLNQHPQNTYNDTEYLITEATLHYSDKGQASGQETYECHSTVRVIPTSHVFRPQRRTPRPRTHGPQTAIVTGPAGREIYSDQYGRVKLSFHWNRYCPKDETSSCWVRVSSAWAGNGFGVMAVPRIGQEVIVDFENGDPDRPIIIGRVYNQLNMPPWGLGTNQTQTGILTRSSEGGGPNNANALRFEDKKGQEEVWLHAEKDQRIEVEHDESHWVGHDRTKTIDHDETNHIKNDRTETVDGHEKITVHKTRTEEVDGDESLTVHSNRSRNVDGHEKEHIGKTKTETIVLAHMQNVGLGKLVNVGAAYSINVGGLMTTVVGAARKDMTAMDHSVNVGKSFVLEAAEVVQIKVGKSELRMDKEGKVTITGAEFLFEASGPVQINGKDIDLN